jgi:hypothetical protein
MTECGPVPPPSEKATTGEVSQSELRAQLLDFVRKIAGLDDGWIENANINLMRATLRECRAEARAIIDGIEGRS